MGEKDLKDYIVKLNDRNIQRQRETGFTLYAILAVLIYCVFYLIDNLPILIAIIQDLNFLNIAILTSNSLFILWLFYLSYETLTRKKRLTKIFPYKEPLIIEFVDLPFFIFLGLICFLNIVSIKNSQNILYSYYLIIFGILAGLNILSPFIINLFRIIKEERKKKKGQSIEKIDFTFFNDKTLKMIFRSLILYASLLSMFSIVLLYNIKTNLRSESIALTLKYVVISYGVLLLIRIFTNIKTKQNENNQMEDFEKEIFFEDISNEKIVKKFEQEFYGIPFSKWISDKQVEIMNFFNKMRQEFLRTDFLLAEVDKIDKKLMPYEFDGRLNNIIIEQIRLLNETNDFIQKVGSNLNKLKNFGSLNDQEIQQLNYVVIFLNNNILGFNNFYHNLSNSISIRQKVQ